MAETDQSTAHTRSQQPHRTGISSHGVREGIGQVPAAGFEQYA